VGQSVQSAVARSIRAARITGIYTLRSTNRKIERVQPTFDSADIRFNFGSVQKALRVEQAQVIVEANRILSLARVDEESLSLHLTSKT
jgi:hypothetical protein